MILTGSFFAVSRTVNGNRIFDRGLLWSDPALSVGDNEPYDGRHGRGYAMMVHGEETGLPFALIEMRQDLIDTHHGAQAWADRLAPILVRRTIDAISEMKQRYALTVLMAEQNFAQAIRIADRGYVIVHGKIAFEGGSADELNNNELVRKFYLGL